MVRLTIQGLPGCFLECCRLSEKRDADVVWTGIVSDALKEPPRFVEQGRERDDLVKLGGHWYIKHRWITADSGLPTMYEKTYKQR
jgi:hypothetical protein